MIATKRQPQTIEKHLKILQQMGFECQHDLQVTHPSSGSYVYDFSAIAEQFLLSYAATKLFERGKHVGQVMAQKKMCDSIGARYGDWLNEQLEEL